MKRIIAVLLAIVMTLSATVTAFAATVDLAFYGSAYEDLARAFNGDEAALQQHYDTFGANEGRAVNLDDAITKGQLSTILRYYSSISEKDYRARAKAGDITYFDAEKYLQANADVAAIAGGSKDYALDHYLKYGMLEGRSSCTAFDPAIAITNHPECLKQALSADSNQSIVDALKASWKAVTGKEDTAGYQFRTESPQSKASASTWTSRGGLGDADTQYAMLMYMCGTDLEDGDGGDATRALLSFIFGAADNQFIGAMLCAGGTDDWQSEYMKSMQPDHNTTVIYEINGANAKKALDALCEKYNVSSFYKLDPYDKDVVNSLITKDILIPVKIYTDNTYPMNSSKTLETFLNVAYEKQLACYYDISFWNHGNGMAEGICFPDGDDSGKGLSAQDIVAATQNSSIKHFDVMAFDLCLMGGVEFATALKDIYTYMLASEETAIGDFDYREMMRIITENIEKDHKEVAQMVAYIAIKDRYLYGNKGTDDSAATFAAYYTEKVMPAAKLVDTVGSELLEIAKTVNTAADGVRYDELIYGAIRNARLHSEGFGGETAFTGYKYVDGSTFLTRLREELSKSAGRLGDAHKAFKDAVSGITAETGTINKASDAVAGLADIFTLSYNHTQLYFSAEAYDETIDNSQYWKDLKGTLITGSSLFVPYEVEDQIITWYSEAMTGVGMDSYVSLISGYNSFINSDAEKTRRKNLAKALYEGDTYSGYGDILSVAYNKAAGDHNSISVVISNYTEAAKISPDSSQDAFVDVIETLESMRTYIMRCADLSEDDGGTLIPVSKYQEIVLGSVAVNTEQAAGQNSTIEIPMESINAAELYSIMGTVNGTEESALKWDYITKSWLDDYDDKIKQVRAALQDGNTSLYTGDLITVRGESDKNDGDVEYHVFEKSADSVYNYIGTVKSDDGNITAKTGISCIYFYHMVDGSGNYLETTKYDEKYYYLTNAPRYDLKNSDGESQAVVLNIYDASELKDAEHNRYYVEATTDEIAGDTRKVNVGSLYGDKTSGDLITTETADYKDDMFDTLPHIGEPEEENQNDQEDSKAAETVKETTEVKTIVTETVREETIQEEIIQEETITAAPAAASITELISESADDSSEAA